MPITVPCVRIEVLGTPAPKGSGRSFGGHFVTGSSAKNARDIKSWEGLVRAAVIETIGRRSSPFFTGVALRVRIAFAMARPAGHWTPKGGLSKSARDNPYPAKKPDIDKLVRCTLDGLTGSVFDDDCRVVSLSTTKRWAEPGLEGAVIHVMKELL